MYTTYTAEMYLLVNRKRKNKVMHIHSSVPGIMHDVPVPCRNGTFLLRKAEDAEEEEDPPCGVEERALARPSSSALASCAFCLSPSSLPGSRRDTRFSRDATVSVRGGPCCEYVMNWIGHPRRTTMKNQYVRRVGSRGGGGGEQV